MSNRALLAFIVVFASSVLAAEAYTVVLRNGKVFQGTLLSENADAIIFKDEKGVQFSLKKSSLDLEKMKTANALKAEEAPKQETAPTQPQSTPEKKKARTYTKEDLDALRQKYGELNAGRSETQLPEQLKDPAAYLSKLQDSASITSDVVKSEAGLAHEIGSIWEISAVNGREPYAWIREFMGRDATKKIQKFIETNLAEVKSTKEILSNPPEAYVNAYQKFATSVDAASTYNDMFQNYLIGDIGDPGRQKLSDLENQVNSAASEITALPAPKSEKKNVNAETETNPSE